MSQSLSPAPVAVIVQDIVLVGPYDRSCPDCGRFVELRFAPLRVPGSAHGRAFSTWASVDPLDPEVIKSAPMLLADLLELGIGLGSKVPLAMEGFSPWPVVQAVAGAQNEIGHE